MKRLRSFALALALSGVASAGELQKAWDFNLSENSASPPGVYRLSFSPNGRWIAAVVGDSKSSAFALLLDADHPETTPRRLDADPKDYITTRDPEWSLSGQQLILGRRIVDLSNHTTCLLPGDGFYFVGSEEVAGRSINPVRLAFYDLGCHLTTAWDLGSPDWMVDDALPEHGILIVQRLDRVYPPRVVDSLMDARTQKINGRFEAPYPPAGPWQVDGRIANNGKSLCGATGPYGRRAVTCREVDSGKEVKYKQDFYDVDVRTATGSRRIVLSDYGRKFEWGDFVRIRGSLKHRTVWDFGTGEVVVAWQPEIQNLNRILNRPSQPYAFAISPDGEYIVEGGAGTVSLYRIFGGNSNQQTPHLD